MGESNNRRVAQRRRSWDIYKIPDTYWKQLQRANRDGKFDDCTSEILAVEDSSRSESDTAEYNWSQMDKIKQKKPKHEAETCTNNNNKTAA